MIKRMLIFAKNNKRVIVPVKDTFTMYGFLFCIHRKLLNKNTNTFSKNTWVVSEFSTGKLIGLDGSKTIKAAKQLAIERLTHFKKSKCVMAINESPIINRIKEINNG